MAHVLDPSLDLEKRIACAPRPDLNKITKIERKQPDGTPLELLDLYRLQYHKEWDDIVELAKEQAVCLSSPINRCY